MWSCCRRAAPRSIGTATTASAATTSPPRSAPGWGDDDRAHRTPAARSRRPAPGTRPEGPGPDGRGPRRPTGRRTNLFLLLFLTGAFLLALGLVMVLSASSVDSLYSAPQSSWFYFRRQLMWLSVGSLALLVTLRIDYRRWRPLARPLMVLTLVLLVAVLLPGLGVSVLGARRWIGFGPFTFQPSELAKLTLALFLRRPARQPAPADHRRAALPSNRSRSCSARTRGAGDARARSRHHDPARAGRCSRSCSSPARRCATSPAVGAGRGRVLAGLLAFWPSRTDATGS